MLAPNASASGPPGAKRGSGSPPVPSVSRVVVAGDAQATTHTSSKSAHGRGRARLLASAQPPVPSLVSDSRVRGGFANPLASKKEASSVCRSNAGLPQRLHAARCVACHGVLSHPVPVALVGECSIPLV